MEAAVEEVARRLTDGQTVPPIKLDLVFHRMKVRSFRVEPDLLSAGELRPADDGFEIAVSGLDSERRRRFSAAHEVAHIVMERTGPWRPRHGAELERLCDMIAGRVLLPGPLLIERLQYPVTVSEIIRIADLFEASLTAAAVRCADVSRVALVQIEDGAIAWATNLHRVGLGRSSISARSLLPTVAEARAGERRFDPADGFPRPLIVGWRPNGPDRTLMVLTDPVGPLLATSAAGS